MKKIFSFITIATMAVMGVSSCNGIEEIHTADKGTHTLVFEGTVTNQYSEAMTKGLQLVAFPDWRGVNTKNIHIFENGVEGESPNFTIKENTNFRLAYLTATFGEETTINPIIPSNTTKAGGEVSWKYNAIIAPKNESGNYEVPAVQNPMDPGNSNNVSFIDPEAEFMIGKTISSINPFDKDEHVNMEFVRPVALFRLAIINMPDKNDGAKIQSVTVNASSAITGQLKKEDIDFDQGIASWDLSNGSKEITVKYEGGAKISTIFYAYFVGAPSETKINSVVVWTDKGKYTYNVNKDWTFSEKKFDSIAIDMSKATKSSDTPEKTDRNLNFSATEATVTIGAGNNSFPTLSGETSGVTYTSDNSNVATVDANTGNVTLVAAGETTITASAAEDDTYKAGNASYVLTVKAADVPAPSTNKTYTKVTSFTSGKKYIIAHGTTALQNQNGSHAGYSISGKVSGNTLTLTSEEAESLEWTATANNEKPEQGKYTLNNGTSYLSRVTSSNAAALAAYNSESAGYFVWNLSDTGNNLYNLNSAKELTFYLYWSNSSWTANTQSATNAIVVYEEDEGGGEVNPPVSGAKYTKVSSITVDKTYIIVDEANKKAFKPVLNSDKNAFLNENTQNAIDVTITDGVITASEAVNACEVTFTNKKSGAEDYSVVVSTSDGDKYLHIAKDNSTSYLAADNDTGYRPTIAQQDNGSFLITRKSTYKFRYSESNSYFQVSNSNSLSASEVALYEYSE